MAQPKKAWHAEDIKAAVRKKGSTLRAISTGANLCLDAGTIALKKPFPSANRAIAKFLGLRLHDLWPQWYDKKGQRIDARSVGKANGKARSCHRKKLAPALASGQPHSPHHPDSARQARGEGVAAGFPPVVTPHKSSTTCTQE